MARAAILTVGNEIVSGDTENTNASWLARRLASLGVEVRLIAAVRDEIEEIAAFLRAEAPGVEHVFVTGGLGGTPDDITREGVAAAFGRECEEIPEVADVLRARFEPRGLGDYAARWACLPRGAEPLMNPLGGAPGFVVENVVVLPGLPSEMEAMFETVADRLRRPADRDLAPQLPHGGGPDRRRPRGGDAPPSGGHGRELPAFPRRRAGGDRRAQVGRRGGPRRRDRVGRVRLGRSRGSLG